MCTQALSKCSLWGKFQSDLSREISAFKVLVADTTREYMRSKSEYFQLSPPRV